ncbi:maleylpyruvate isomerase N-terminal domain-containing protein [Martelella sp. HB161492]|uniref:maleylpyruvate isomerase N-terminal domain-containing protein n=1 Tax=Martelella sp. HB161492 TaxID=2720726 RepID=UPI00158FB884|nr:maleylpyruvate isomerase N-terminal domain-containing protein [Martelella sp. HB161492]
MTGLDDARRALIERQGPGARYDAPEAPAEMLHLARTGTAYFARFLNRLSDRNLYQPLRADGLTPAHVVCAVSYQARAIARQAEAITAAEPVPPLHDTLAEHKAMIDFGATLPARALRHLFDHASVHLNVVWRDLPGHGWQAAVPGIDGAMHPFADTVRARACFIWAAAFELNNGARKRDLPAALLAAGCNEFAA